MIDHTQAIGLSAALLMGLAGSAHCFGMCGGIAGALGMRSRSRVGESPRISLDASLYQIGRISGYIILGTLAGAIGATLQSIVDLAQVGIAFRIASGVLLLFIAARMLVHWNGLAAIERAGARLWRHIQPLTRKFSGGNSFNTFALGLLWGFLPCGMVYSMLAFAALSGSALGGAMLMLLFGLGTAPAMFGSTFLATKSSQIFGATWAKRTTGTLLALFGIWMISAPFITFTHLASGHAGHVH